MSVAGVMPQPTGPDYSSEQGCDQRNLSLSLTKAARCIGSDGRNTVSPGKIAYAETRGSIPSDGNY